MGWLGWLVGERSDGDTGNVSDVDVNVKVNDSGHVTDILVANSNEGRETHDHFYNVDGNDTGAVSRVDWNK